MSETITLNLEDRTLQMAGTRLDMGVQGDEGFQEFSFLCPLKVSDTIRLNQCDICIAYKNTKSGISGVDEIDNFMLSGSENASFTWRPKKKVFLFPGIVQFTLWLIKYNGDNIEWSWHSRRAEGLIYPMALNEVVGIAPADYEQTSILVPSGLTVTEVD